MLGKLSQIYLEQENVLTRCYDDPGVLEQYLNKHRVRRFRPVIGLCAILACALCYLAFPDSDFFDFMSLEFIWLMMVFGAIGEIQMRNQLHRIQSLRLIQHLRSQE